MANSNVEGVLLNGVPSVVELDQPALREIEKRDRLLASEGATIFAHEAPDMPTRQERPGGGARFVFRFRAAKCRPCKDVASVRVAYDFDAQGKFLGVRSLGAKRARR